MSKRPRLKRKGKKKKKTTIEELVDGSIQLPEVNYFISQAECHGGNDKYSLIKQMLKALEYDARTETGIKPKSLVVRDLCTGVPLHFSPNPSSVVTHPDDANQFDDFTFVNTRGHCGHATTIKTRVNRINKMFSCNEPVIGKYKGNDVRLHKTNNLPIDDIILSMKAHEDIMPFNKVEMKRRRVFIVIGENT